MAELAKPGISLLDANRRTSRAFQQNSLGSSRAFSFANTQGSLGNWGALQRTTAALAGMNAQARMLGSGAPSFEFNLSKIETPDGSPVPDPAMATPRLTDNPERAKLFTGNDSTYSMSRFSGDRAVISATFFT